ncbi:hypothetical protein K4K55_005035 [Colletotrichum sp. SAR 10_96]|nr:hypothetical protein K4K55_005035 [Colletotrichum sp. SAR 10_96]
MSAQTSTSTITVDQSPFRLVGTYGDFRDDLISQGYAVVKNAIDPAKARQYQQRAFAWLKSFDTALDLNDPSTWIDENLPVQSKINSFEKYAATHERFIWEARQEPGVLDAFSKIWGTDELFVSFDSFNITFPNRKDKPPRAPWPHVDQSPLKRGMHCVQGIISLSHAGPEDGSLVVVPKSHKALDKFFDTQTDPKSWKKEDVFPFTKKDMEWFRGEGLEPAKVQAEPGDLILWDSRVAHWGGDPTEKSDTIRTIIYATYTPRNLATEAALAEKKRVFEAYGYTTHWPHDNIALEELDARLPDDYPEKPRREKWIMDWFSYSWETPYGELDSNFPHCKRDRPQQRIDESKYMYLINHVWNIAMGARFEGETVKIPTRLAANITNSMDSISRQVKLCKAKWGKIPNVILLDFIDVGDAIKAQDHFNS